MVLRHSGLPLHECYYQNKNIIVKMRKNERMTETLQEKLLFFIVILHLLISNFNQLDVLQCYNDFDSINLLDLITIGLIRVKL